MSFARPHLDLLSGQLFVGMLLCALISGCGDSGKPDSSEPKASSLPSAPSTLGPQEKDGPIWFRDLSFESGLHFRNRSGSPEKLMIPENIGQGVLAFDFDNDSDLDLYFPNGGELGKPGQEEYPNVLYRNLGNFRFERVEGTTGLECLDWSCGAYAMDIDGDGWRDVYVTQLGPNRFFRNLEGTGRFEDISNRVGAADPSWSASAAFFDADGDSDLDLYVGNYLEFDPKNPPKNGVPCEWRNLKVCCGPRGLPEAPDSFFENVGGRFVDATKKFGFEVRGSRGQRIGGYSLGVVSADFDEDGDQDVYVAVDSRPNLFFLNQGQGKFEEKAQAWQIALNQRATEQAGMGVTASDLNGDNRLDIFVTNFSHDTNTLYLNDGPPDNVFFDDRTAQIGLGGEASYPFLSWGTGAHDFDLDGRLDIFVASGHVYPQAEGVSELGTSYAQRNQLFMCKSLEKLRFEDAALSAGPALSQRKVSRGTAYCDFDRDGRMDIVVTNIDDFPNLLQNDCSPSGPWIGLMLVDSNPKNRDAIGASLRVVTESGRKIRRDVLGGGGYLGGSDPGLLFSWGQDVAKELVVRWPDGAQETLDIPAPNQWHRLQRSEGKKSRFLPIE